MWLQKTGCAASLPRAISSRWSARKAPRSAITVWYGTWVIRAVAPGWGETTRCFVTSRSVLKLRDFKTIVGLVSFLADMGCTTASIPLVEGARERHAAPGRTPETRTGPVSGQGQLTARFALVVLLGTGVCSAPPGRVCTEWGRRFHLPGQP